MLTSEFDFKESEEKKATRKIGSDSNDRSLRKSEWHQGLGSPRTDSLALLEIRLSS